jgi:hypothetical protein
MDPLKYIKFIVDHLEGTAFEPWVNGLLFLLFLTAVVVATRLIVGRKTIETAIISDDSPNEFRTYFL